MNNRGFYLENALEPKNEKYVVSQRFLDENKEPMEWELRSLTRLEDEDILHACMKKSILGYELDNFKYIGMSMASAVVDPTLNEAEMQDAYNVKSSHELLRAMLTAKEFNALQRRVSFIGNEMVDLDKVFYEDTVEIDHEDKVNEAL